MLTLNTRAEPRITRIKNGWAAYADWWAVHAPTREEVIELFRERSHFYEELEARRQEAPRDNSGDSSDTR